MQRHARILDAELFVGGEGPSRQESKGRIGGEVESVGAARQTDDGPSGAQMGTEQHDVFVLMLHHGRVVDRFYRVGDIGFGEDRIVSVSSDDVRLMLFASSSKIVW